MCDTIYTIDDIKAALHPVFVKHSVKKAILFGSYVKGIANKDSDVDLLLDSGLRGLKFVGLIEDVRLALDKEVDEKTPATIIIASREDTCVPIVNSLAYAVALEKANIPFEMHIYEKGYHGFSLADHTVYSKAEEEYNAHLKGWFELVSNWLYKRFEL